MLIDQTFEKLGMNKSMEVFMYILQNTNGDTKIFSKTYNEIQKATGASQMTISKVFKMMEEIGAVEYLGKSRWRNNAVLGYSNDCGGLDYFVENKGS